MATKRSRKFLRDRFKHLATPTEGDFADFIESSLNLRDDGIELVKDNNNVIIETQDENAKLVIGGDLQVKKNLFCQTLRIPDGEESGLTISDSSGNSKLFMDNVSGNVGLDSTTPDAKLAINGGLHVGGDSDPGDDNLLVDGDLIVKGTIQGNIKETKQPPIILFRFTDHKHYRTPGKPDLWRTGYQYDQYIAAVVGFKTKGTGGSEVYMVKRKDGYWYIRADPEIFLSIDVMFIGVEWVKDTKGYEDIEE